MLHSIFLKLQALPVFILSERTDINITQNAEKRINTERQDFDMKYMNNHFGQSRIFGKARFMAEPAGDIGGDDPGSSGGGSGNGESDDNKPSVEELMARLAKAESDNQKNKLALDKALKEKVSANNDRSRTGGNCEERSR